MGRNVSRGHGLRLAIKMGVVVTAAVFGTLTVASASFAASAEPGTTVVNPPPDGEPVGPGPGVPPNPPTSDTPDETTTTPPAANEIADKGLDNRVAEGAVVLTKTTTKVAVNNASTGLANTGSNVAAMALTGAVLVGAGALITLATLRRRRNTT